MMADEFLNTKFLEGFDQEDVDFLSRAFDEIQEMEKEIYACDCSCDCEK